MARFGVITAGYLLAAFWTPHSHAQVVVAYESGVEAYGEALAGIETELDVRAVRSVDVRDVRGAAELSRLLGSRETRVAVAVGSRALAEIEARHPAAPVVAAMALRENRPRGEAPAAEVDVEATLASQLEVMRILLPNRWRVGIIHNSSSSRHTAAALEARARKSGFTAVVAECDGPARLLKAMASFKGKVDFVLCFPDPELFNAVTIKPMILASLEMRLPVVGFSPAFVRAGAAAGIYPDYRESGRQAAALATRLLKGDDHPGMEAPAKVKVAINERLERLLGLDFQRTGLPVEVMR